MQPRPPRLQLDSRFITVRLKSGGRFLFASSATADYVVGKLRACGVPNGGIAETIHVIPKGTIPAGTIPFPQKGAQPGSGPKTT